MSAYRLTIQSPTGEVLDASRYLEIGQIGDVECSPESDLGILTHGEMSLPLDNSDGVVEEFLRDATVTDRYDVILEREKPDGSGGWDRLFGGVLDLPYSLSYDDKDKTAAVTAYSYSKQLERTPATGIRRTIGSKTASINGGTTSMAFLAGASQTADIAIGDVIRLNNGQNIEDYQIALIVDADHAEVLEASNGTFIAAYAEITTQFYRDKGPEFLLQEIATASGVSLNNLDIGSPLFPSPVATPLSMANLGLLVVPRSLIAEEVAGVHTITAAWRKTLTSQYYIKKTLASPTSAWVFEMEDGEVLLDWTPYKLTRPSNLVQTYHNISSSDTGSIAVDYSTFDIYYIQVVSGTRHLFKTLNDMGSADPNDDDSVNEDVRAVEVDSATGRVFLCFYRKGNAAIQKFRYYDGTFHDIATVGVGGWLRCIRYYNSTRIVRVDVNTNDLHIYDGTLPTGAVAEKVLRWAGLSTDRVMHWTMRTWGVGADGGALYLSVIFKRDQSSWVALYDARGPIADWRPMAEYRVSTQPPFTYSGLKISNTRAEAYQTVMTMPTGEQFAVGHSGGQWFVLAKHYAGVIPYADFSDSSCAKAARDVVTCINSFVNFDQFGVMTVTNRSAIGRGDIVADLGVPLTSERRPVSDLYRASVEVTGTATNGDAVREVQGKDGDSARRLTVSSDLITTGGMALAVASTTLQFVGAIRQQLDVTVPDDGTPLAVFDRVLLYGRPWVIYKLNTDLEMQLHTMTLLELDQ